MDNQNKQLLFIDSKLTYVTETDRHLYVDFESQSLLKRIKQGAKNNLLARALGLNKNKGYIIDCTGGLGVDAFIAASLGAKVILCERNETMHKLLEDGIQRGVGSNNKTIQDISECLFLQKCDAISQLPELVKQYHPICVYIDPMYPIRTKSALGKVNMREILEIVGNDDDAHNLAEIATQNTKRVAIKRPKLAPELLDKDYEFQVMGNSTRFDIYINPNIK